MQAPAQVIADVYKERWQIELFFKALKQNLKIKTFIGTSLNAVMTQIWTALIAMRWCGISSCARRGKAERSPHALESVHVSRLWDWLENPTAVLPQGPPVEQLSLAF